MTLSAACTAPYWAGHSQTTLSIRPRMGPTVPLAGIQIRDDGKPSAECHERPWAPGTGLALGRGSGVSQSRPRPR